MANQQPNPLAAIARPVSTFNYTPVDIEAQEATPIPQEIAGESGPGAYGQDTYNAIQTLVGAGGEFAARAIKASTDEENRQAQAEGMAERWKLQKSYAKAWADGDITGDMNPYFLIAYEEADAGIAREQFIGEFRAEYTQRLESGDKDLLSPDGYNRLYESKRTEFLNKYVGSDSANAALAQSPYWGNTFGGGAELWKARHESKASTEITARRETKILDSMGIDFSATINRLVTGEITNEEASEYLLGLMQANDAKITNKVAIPYLIDVALGVVTASADNAPKILDFLENHWRFGQGGEKDLVVNWRDPDQGKGGGTRWQAASQNNANRIAEATNRAKSSRTSKSLLTRRNYYRDMAAQGLSPEEVEKRIRDRIIEVEGSDPDERRMLREIGQYNAILSEHGRSVNSVSMTDQKRGVGITVTEMLKGAIRGGNIPKSEIGATLGAAEFLDELAEAGVFDYVVDGEVKSAEAEFTVINDRPALKIDYGLDSEPSVLYIDDLHTDTMLDKLNDFPREGEAHTIPELIGFYTQEGWAHPRIGGATEEWLNRPPEWYRDNREEIYLHADAHGLLTAFRDAKNSGLDLSVFGPTESQDTLHAALLLSKGNLSGGGSFDVLNRVSDPGTRERMSRFRLSTDFYMGEVMIKDPTIIPAIDPRYMPHVNDIIHKYIMESWAKNDAPPLTRRGADGGVFYPTSEENKHAVNKHTNAIAELLANSFETMGGASVPRSGWLRENARTFSVGELGSTVDEEGNVNTLKDTHDIAIAMDLAVEAFVDNIPTGIENDRASGMLFRQFADVHGARDVQNWTLQILNPEATEFMFVPPWGIGVRSSRVILRSELVDLLRTADSDKIKELQDKRRNAQQEEPSITTKDYRKRGSSGGVGPSGLGQR